MVPKDFQTFFGSSDKKKLSKAETYFFWKKILKKIIT